MKGSRVVGRRKTIVKCFGKTEVDAPFIRLKATKGWMKMDITRYTCISKKYLWTRSRRNSPIAYGPESRGRSRGNCQGTASVILKVVQGSCLYGAVWI